MIRIPAGLYYTVNEYRQMIGYSSPQPIYRAIREERLKGAISIGRTYLIPSGTTMINNRLKSGRYVGVSKLIKENKENG